ncbi:unnamed protein product, partial [Citrullus colocynthis]
MAPTAAMLTLSHHHPPPPIFGHPPPPPASSAPQFSAWTLLQPLSAAFAKPKLLPIPPAISDPSSQSKPCVSEAFESGNFW